MAGGGTKAVVAALLANTGIAVTKFAAWGLTQSASMLAEAIHSVADAGNQVLLLVGGKRARREADELHQFGFGRERYVYSFIVAIVLFSVGGLFALYEGYHKIHDPHPIENWKWVPVVVLVAAIIMETLSFRTAIVEANKVRGQVGWAKFVRQARSPELPVILLEDFAALTGLVLALIGVVLTLVTGNGVWDGVGSMAIGALLVVVAIFLAIEMKSLLLGESATREAQQKIVAAIENTPGVQKLIHIKTLHLGPEEVLVAAKLGVEPTTDAAVVAQTINAAEQAVREAEPMSVHIYLEPDIYVEGYVREERPAVPEAPSH
ncbi:cation diffusion facilitator family transporter [Kribbella amoyensis]|uniref:Cation diffusion facilitator family transporter n=1 Tax=Kribbella amoyensis TaxID=996641 RepID=A0A561BTK2_9ACTN|nr:cation diffusion facilitator family transporter [Kribbella amoyensis]TWD82142.1 cation diffusion facilitator family transporter [Kribbella amoyensis]